MFGITYDDKYRLIDEDYLEEHIPEILSLNTYVPSILTGIMREIYVDPDVFANWKLSLRNNKKLSRFYIRQKSLRQQFAHEKIKLFLPIFLELLIFLVSYPEFRGMIKDEDYLEELIKECETEYNIDIVQYINDYSDIRRLLKELKD